MTELLKRPSGVIPLAMSGVALAIVVGYATMFGTARQPDEGAAAHLWQLLMIGQLPVVAWFAVTCLPSRPRQALGVLTAQISAALAAIFPVLWFHW
jgi:hypothetical protein